MTVTLVLLTRDLRVHDNPALAAAARWSARVIPLFVLDDAILRGGVASPNRAVFLGQALTELRSTLRDRGADLVLRHGDPVEEAIRVATETGAEWITTSADVSQYAQRRHERLARTCEQERIGLRTFPGVTVVPPGSVTPAGGDHYRIFTPYWRAWLDTPRRPSEPAPGRLRLPPKLAVGRLPGRAALVSGGDTSPDLPTGGSRTGRAVLDAVIRRLRRLGGAEPDRDALAADNTTRLSPYLHFGCLSPLVVAERLADAGADDLHRQLCWRDFFHQITSAFPAIGTNDYRRRERPWKSDPEALEAWKAGRTGVPLVDAGMRQLRQEGWMHNRARLVTASFLTKQLGIDWRAGAAHFFVWLVDGDIANNSGNWQWVAGTGNDTRPGRVFNPVRQGHRFDRNGDYVRQYLPELASISGPAVHEPWKLPEPDRRVLDYPAPITEPTPRRLARPDHRDLDHG